MRGEAGLSLRRPYKTATRLSKGSERSCATQEFKVAAERQMFKFVTIIAAGGVSRATPPSTVYGHVPCGKNRLLARYERQKMRLHWQKQEKKVIHRFWKTYPSQKAKYRTAQKVLLEATLN